MLADGRFAVEADALRLYPAHRRDGSRGTLPPLPDVTPTWTAAADHARELRLAGVAAGSRRPAHGRDQPPSVRAAALDCRPLVLRAHSGSRRSSSTSRGSSTAGRPSARRSSEYTTVRTSTPSARCVTRSGSTRTPSRAPRPGRQRFSLRGVRSRRWIPESFARSASRSPCPRLVGDGILHLQQRRDCSPARAGGLRRGRGDHRLRRPPRKRDRGALPRGQDR